MVQGRPFFESEPTEDGRFPLITVDSRKCTACGRCVRVCPPQILGQGATVPESPGADRSKSCLLCGHCVASCPSGALNHRAFDLRDFTPAKRAQDPEVVLDVFQARRSVRLFEQRSVGSAAVHELLEAAASAPTGTNARAVGCVALLTRFARDRLRSDLVSFYRRIFRVVGSRMGRSVLRAIWGEERARQLADLRSQVRQLESRFERGEDPLFWHAPAVLLLHAPEGNETSEVDCSLAASQITLLAPSLGLGTCYIGYASAALKRRPRLARTHGVPRGHRVYVVLAAGYPQESFCKAIPRAGIPIRFR